VTSGGWSPIVELRQYTLHPGGRDVLIDLFEREFIESQEDLGMKVIGQFVDLDDPDRFVWLRGFSDMDARERGLASFYDGPVWAAHRDVANATMIDCDDVLLLKPARNGSGFQLGAERPHYGGRQQETLAVEATILGLSASAPELHVVEYFEMAVLPQIARYGRTVLGYFVTESHPNNFPRLPVREGEQVFVWFDVVPREDAVEGAGASGEAAVAELVTATPGLAAKPKTLRLRPTLRSLLNGASRPCVA
jgi:hypothetical protein